MSKIRVVFLFFCLFLIAILVKLFYVQLINPLTSDQNSALRYHKIQPERGKIYDRNNQPLVLNKTTYLLYAEPKNVTDKNELIDKLHNILQEDTASIEARFNDSLDWVKLANGLSQDQKNQIDASKLKGIGFEEEPARFYPEASLAAHLLGFVGKNNNGDDVGYFGVEGFYDKDLIGLPGFIKTERDILGRPIYVGSQERVDTENGRDLILTIDKSVQDIVKQNLVKGIERYKAKSGCIIVANPNTLEILALACQPDFDPDTYYNFSDSVFNNGAISSLYEPGSTFKPLVVAAGIQEKAIKPDDMFDENGPAQVGDYSIRTWDNKYEGKISITRILEKSSNVGMVWIGSKLGDKKTLEYVKKYGFGQQTGIDLEGETSGYLRQQWYPIDYATVTFGQGIAVSPIQMVRAFSSLINGGKLMRPYIVKQVGTDTDKQEIQPHVDSTVISPETSEIMKQMLVSTVEHGEYKWALPEGYHIGGKTGTAQIAIAGRYDASKTIASFIGFAPAAHPQFIALVVLHEPGTSIYGSETAAPLFFDIAKELLYYYNIPPQ